MEYISGMVVSFIIILLGLQLMGSSFDKILHPQAVTISVLTYVVLVISILVKLWQGIFNRTVGKEKGIIVNVTLMSNASQIGQKLVNAQNGVAGVPAMPDLFFCHNSNAQELGANNLLDW